MSRSTAYCGKHKCTIDGDLFHLQIIGEMTAHEAQRLADEMSRVANAQGQIFLIVALEGSDKPPPEARRVMSKALGKLPLQALVYYGGNPVLRTILTLMNRAAALMSGRAYPVHFCATEAEALAWLADRRARLAGERAPVSS